MERLLIALLLLAVAAGCTATHERLQGLGEHLSSPESSLQSVWTKSAAEPYISKIEPENLELRRLAASVTSDCPSGDVECQITEIYRYVVENYSYYSDPRSREFIQTPSETIYVRGGDCEDLTILLISLLENIGIKTYFVMTEDHAYALACGVSPEKLWKYVREAMILQASRDLAKSGEMEVEVRNGELFAVSAEEQSIALKHGELYYYGGNGTPLEPPVRYMNIEYEVSSTKPVDIYVVPSERDFRALSERRAYRYYPECTRRSVLRVSGKCSGLRQYGGVVIVNTGAGDAVVSMRLRFYFSYDTQALLR
ncbi:MAG: transglutaminase domain-containing protein, partial [Euryarchaeota archaeon]|nr:transglutaminase domain-containing protein [Euryarchaeota archaeon]